MKKRLEEIERNMRSILEEINKISGGEYLDLGISFWPKHKPEHFKISLWDGKEHAPISLPNYEGSAEELIAWITKKEILFQKFDKVLQEEKK